MVAHDDEDDLFQHTSMTFGEHLEELRAALFKAVIALVIGFAIGLYFAPTIVRVIQTPLENGLTTYYQEEAIAYLREKLPEPLKEKKVIHDRVLEEGLWPELIFVEPGASARAGLQAADDAKLTRSGLIPVWTWRPLSEDERVKLRAFNIQEGFVIWMKAALLFGAVVSSPFVFYFLWQFVAAGLYPHEKRYVHLFLPASLGLFIGGAALAFLAVFPPVLKFFFGINRAMGQVLEPRISEWLSFVLLLPLGFGVAFQLPLVMLFLARIHIFSAELYLSKWKIAVLLMAIAAMILSPGGDPYSMMMMLGPLVLLYFGGIGLCKWLPDSRPRATTTPKAKQLAEVD
ncbi:MAG: twin-arginine translocase subunit TatC [Pirellulales bacterium]